MEPAMDVPTRPDARRNPRPPLRVGGDNLLLRLAPRESRRLRIAAPVRLEVLRGRAWVTVDGEHEDRFPARGEHLALPVGANALVSGDSTDRSTLLKLIALDPLRTHSTGPLARLAGRLSWVGS